MYFRFYFVLLLCCVSRSFSDDFIENLSNIEWICANENCSEPISVAQPKHNYVGDHKLKVRLAAHEKVNIYGKPSNEKKEDVWLVKVGDKAGVVPQHVLKEHLVLVKPSDCIKSKIDLNSFIQRSTKAADIQSSKISPSPTHEVIDGTTIPVVGSYDNDSSETDVTVDTEESLEDSELSAGVLGNSKAGGALNDLRDVPEIPLTDPAPQPSEEDSTSSDNNIPDVQKSENLNDSQNVETSTVTQEGLLKEDILDKTSSSLKIEANEEHANLSEKVKPSVQEFVDNKEKEETITTGPLPPKVLSENSPSDTDQKSVNTTHTAIDEPMSANSENSISTHESVQDKPVENIPGSVPQAPFGAGYGITDNIERETESPSNFKQGGSESPGYQFMGSSPNISPEPENLNTNVAASEVEPASNKNTYTHNPAQSPSTMPSTEQGPLLVSETGTLRPSTENQETTPLPVSQVTSSSENLDVRFDSQNVALPGTRNGFPLPSNQDESSLSSTQGAESLPSFQDPIPSSATQDGSSPTPQDTGSLPGSQDAIPLPVTSDATSSSDAGTLLNNANSLPGTRDASLLPDTQGGTLLPEDEDLSLLADTQNVSPVPDTQREGSLPETSAENLDVVPEQFTKENTESPTDSTNSHEDVLAESGTDWFSPLSSVVKSFKDMFSNSDIGVDDTETINDFATESYSGILQPSTERPNEYEDINQSCDKEGFCNASPGNSEGASYSIPGFEGGTVSGASLIYVTITSVIVLLFSLGYYYIENLRRDTELIAKVNSLSAELFFAQKELSTMEEKISQTSENKLASNTTVNEEELIKLRQDLDESKAVNNGLELEIKRMEKEIEELVESNDEMHKMLTESITEDDRTQSLLANIADLKSVLSERLEEIATLTQQLDQEKQQVELLTIALQKTEEQKENIEEKLQKVLNEIDSKALAVTKEFEGKVTSLEKIIEESSLERTNFEKEICELKAECEKLSAEKELSEKALKKAQGMGPGKALAEWLDAKEVRVELVTAQKEVEKLRRELDEAKEHEAKLQEQKNELQSQIEILNNNYETAEKTKIETLTKLQVLSNYFKEKETQLQEELGEKEAQWLQKQSEDHTIYEQMRSLREENLSYKAQNEALKKEILDQEASFKIQIANEEQKSQENWVALRHTERRLKEAQMEAAHLRSRLTALETNPDSLDDKHKSLEMVNGEVGLVGPGSPPFMLYPPPHDFIPPPPLVSPSRPPPLGRLSSPPLTPPPPLSPYDLYPPPPTAPSPPTLRGPPLHKPQPRDPPQQRKQKESQSSNHSSESMEKPVRRGKR